MEQRDTQTGIARIAVLDNDIRAALYRQLVERDDWVTRDEAAELAGIPRPVAAFHLDKLTEAGFLETRYERTSGRTGPGAGRPSKLYRRTGRETSVSVPERRYPLAGHLLAAAVEEAERTGRAIGDVLPKLAKREGRTIAKQSRNAGATSDREGLLDVLKIIGYEPGISDGEIVLKNCPFHELSQQHVGLVCGMNLDLLRGVVEGIGDRSLKPRLCPEPGKCCVRISRTGKTRR
jgi:predicted ArsR family transcriptional regulator